MKYTVTVTQAIYVSGSVLIEADSPEAAKAQVAEAIRKAHAPSEELDAAQTMLLDDIACEMADYLADCGTADISDDCWMVDDEVTDENGDDCWMVDDEVTDENGDEVAS